MEAVINYVVREIANIARAPLLFASALLVLGGAIWWAMDWRYSGIIINRDSELSSVRAQRDEYRDKLEGASPSEAKARIDDLEARLRRLEPRRLAGETRQKFSALLSGARGNSKVAIVAEASGDTAQFAADLAASFREANWQVTEEQIVGLHSRPSQGLSIRIPDPNSPTDTARTVIRALSSIGVQFDMGPLARRPDGATIEILVATVISR